MKIKTRCGKNALKAFATVGVASRREDLVISGRVEDGVVAGHDPVTTVGLGPGDRALLAQRGIGRHRISRVGLRVVVKLDNRGVAITRHMCSPLFFEWY